MASLVQFNVGNAAKTKQVAPTSKLSSVTFGFVNSANLLKVSFIYVSTCVQRACYAIEIESPAETAKITIATTAAIGSAATLIPS